jgi:hypothetical protein
MSNLLEGAGWVDRNVIGWSRNYSPLAGLHQLANFALHQVALQGA